MTSQSHKKHPTTAPKREADSSAVKAFNAVRHGRLAKATLALAIAFSSTAAGQQNGHYAPPVHIQPQSYSVFESPDQPTATATGIAPPTQIGSNPQYNRQANVPEMDQATRIAMMADYMRRQNDTVKYARDAQVNAALQQKDGGFYNPSYAAPAVRQHAHPTPPAQGVYQPPVARTRPTAAAQTRTSSAQARQRRVATQQRQSAQSQTQPSRQQPSGASRQVGLQERISGVFRRRPQTATPIPVAPVPVAATPTVAHREPEMTVENVVQELRQPMPRARQAQPAPRRKSPTRAIAKSPDRATTRIPTRSSEPVALVDHITGNSKGRSSETVIPGFIPQDTPEVDLPAFDFEDYTASQASEIQLAAKQEAVGSGVRPAQRAPATGERPSSNQLDDYVPQNPPPRFARRQREASVFDQSPRRLPARPVAVNQQPAEGSPFSTVPKTQFPEQENELPGRDKTSLTDVQDRDSAEEARRAREKRLDSLTEDDLGLGDDDDFDDTEIEEDDEDLGPPVFDDRGCEEFRSSLLDKSIRDISLDISPPGSYRSANKAQIFRTWTDSAGNTLATGTMVDLRRGYVILDSGQKLAYAKLGKQDWEAIEEFWLLPSSCTIGDRGNLARNWSPQTVTWHASNLCHKPLYFENVQLERYGHSHGPFMQPIQTTFHFVGRLLTLPYQTAIHPPNECQYSLGFYRPGNCAPWLLEPIPFSRAGIRRQTLVSLGLAFIP